MSWGLYSQRLEYARLCGTGRLAIGTTDLSPPHSIEVVHDEGSVNETAMLGDSFCI